MKTGWWIAIGIVAVLLLGAFSIISYGVGVYNNIQTSSINVDTKWGFVQTAYQRRADLIPNLVETVKGYKNFEHDTLVEVTQMRSQAGQAQIAVNSATNPAQLQDAMGGMNSVLSRLMVIIERYPDLKANQNFMALQDELAGTENRIKVERDNFNVAVQSYNVIIKTFPSNLIANIFGFQPRTMFAADAGSQVAPKVSFD